MLFVDFYTSLGDLPSIHHDRFETEMFSQYIQLHCWRKTLKLTLETYVCRKQNDIISVE